MPVTPADLAVWKQRRERFVMLTAYDALTARVLDEAGIPLLLVGDSVGNNVLGYDTTIPVTMEEALVFTAAVARGARNALVVADLPFGAYQASPVQAVANAARLVKAGANAVKLEGGRRSAKAVRRMTQAGIPVMGHLGYTPQSANAFGRKVVRGRGQEGDELLADALALQEAGCFAIVLEAIPAELGTRLTEAVEVATIGIGAGPERRRPGAGHHRPARADPRPDPALRQALRRPAGDHHRGGRPLRQGRGRGPLPGTRAPVPLTARRPRRIR